MTFERYDVTTSTRVAALGVPSERLRQPSRCEDWMVDMSHLEVGMPNAIDRVLSRTVFKSVIRNA